MPAAQLRRPLLAAAASGLSRPTATLPTANTLGQLHEALAQLRIGGAAESRRWASVKAQGAYKLRDSKTIPKKLGAKKTGDMYVIPGNIIFKQRGTKWFPGENVGMGRDHTIFSLATGYVKYYKDPAKHPKRQYIGVVFDKNDKLPYHRHAMRKRKLGLTANVIVPPAPIPELSSSGIPNQVIRTGTGRKPNPRDTRILKLGAGGDPYAYAEESWRLGTLVRTEKRKMGSRRVAMRARRIKRKGILNEMRELREDKIRARKQNAANRYKNYMARRRLKYEKFVASRNAELHAAASNPKGAEMPPPPPPGPTAGASASAKAGGKTDGKAKAKSNTKTKA